MILIGDLLFVEIPRTGTSTIRECFDHTVLHDQRHISFPDYLKIHPEHSNLKRVCFTRNPFERVVSLYEHSKHFHQVPETETFDKFCEWYVSDEPKFTLDEIRMTQVQMITLGEMSSIFSFELFDAHLKAMIRQYNLKLKSKPVMTNTFLKQTYRNYYNVRTKYMIGDFVKDDLEWFGYEY